jgi:hypothetical protein
MNSDGIRKLYDVKLIEEDKQHFYLIGDDPTYYPGVTGALGMMSKPALMPWTAKSVGEYIVSKIKQFEGAHDDRFLDLLLRRGKKQAKFIKNSAANLGSRLHAAMNTALTGGDGVGIEITKDMAIAMASFKWWIENNKEVEIISGDIKIGSKRYKCGGSLDLLGRDRSTGKIIVLDFKTGKSIWPEHAFQTSAYAYFLEEQYGLPYTPDCQIIRFDQKQVAFELRKVENVTKCFANFLSCLSLYNNARGNPFSTQETIKRDVSIKNRKTKETIKL